MSIKIRITTNDSIKTGPEESEKESARDGLVTQTSRSVSMKSSFEIIYLSFIS